MSSHDMPSFLRQLSSTFEILQTGPDDPQRTVQSDDDRQHQQHRQLTPPCGLVRQRITSLILCLERNLLIIGFVIALSPPVAVHTAQVRNK